MNSMGEIAREEYQEEVQWPSRAEKTKTIGGTLRLRSDHSTSTERRHIPRELVDSNAPKILIELWFG